MSATHLLICVGLLLSMAAFSTDSILPMLPLMAADLDIPITAMQWVVPLFMAGYGIGQLLFGSISDRFGRKPALLSGLGIYLIGTLICLATDELAMLLIGRLIQGIGGGAGQSVARAMMRDRFSGPALARNMATATAIFAVGPMFAPLLGVWVAGYGAWRGVFAGMALLGVLLAIMVWRLAETSRRLNPSALDPQTLLKNANTVVGDPQSRYFLLLAGFAFTAIVLFLASMPRIFTSAVAASPAFFAAIFGVAAFGIVLGQLINRRLIRTLGTIRAMQVGAGLLLTAALLCASADGLYLLSAWTLGVVMLLFNAGYLVIFSNAVSLVIDPHAGIAGFAASIAGLTASLIGSTLGGSLIAFVADESWRFGLCLGMIASIILTALFRWQSLEKR